MITQDEFELAYRRYHDDGGHTGPDQFSCICGWRHYQDNPTEYNYLEPFLPGGEKHAEWQDQ